MGLPEITKNMKPRSSSESNKHNLMRATSVWTRSLTLDLVRARGCLGSDTTREVLTICDRRTFR